MGARAINPRWFRAPSAAPATAESFLYSPKVIDIDMRERFIARLHAAGLATNDELEAARKGIIDSLLAVQLPPWMQTMLEHAPAIYDAYCRWADGYAGTTTILRRARDA